MARPEGIKVEGLAQFSRNLRKIDKDLPKTLRVAVKQGADLLANEVKPRVPRHRGRAAASVKAKATRTAARVREGGDRAPYVPWLDFGGRTGRRRSVKRPYLKDGRFLYESYYKLKDSGDIQDILQKALLDVARRAGVVVE